MTTILTRPVTRAVATLRGRPLVITLCAEGIQFREKGRRTRYLLPYGAGFTLAARLFADEVRRQTIRKQAERRAARARR